MDGHLEVAEGAVPLVGVEAVGSVGSKTNYNRVKEEVRKMKLCVTSSGKSLEDTVDPRFGRCQYFIFVDSENLQFEAIQNPAATARGGAGTKSGQLVANKGAEVVLTGNVGPNAFDTLQAAGLKIIVGLSDTTVKQAIEGFNTGSLGYAAMPSVKAHHGAF